MAQTAAHLVEHVIPKVPVRQWVLSLPIPLRLLLAAQPKLVQRVITGHLLDALALARRCNWATRYPTPANDSLRCIAGLHFSLLLTFSPTVGCRESYPAGPDWRRTFTDRQRMTATCHTPAVQA